MTRDELITQLRSGSRLTHASEAWNDWESGPDIHRLDNVELWGEDLDLVYELEAEGIIVADGDYSYKLVEPD